MRRYLPALLLALTAFAPFPLAGCDLINKLRGGGEAADAAPEAAAPEVVIDAAPVVEPEVDAAPALKPTVVAKKVDAGVVDAGVVDAAPAATADASAAIADAGAQLADAATKLLMRPDGGRITIPKGLLKRLGQ